MPLWLPMLELSSGRSAGGCAEHAAALASPVCSWRGGLDRREDCHHLVSHRLSQENCQRILLTFNEPEFAQVSPEQIVPILAD